MKNPICETRFPNYPHENNYHCFVKCLEDFLKLGNKNNLRTICFFICCLLERYDYKLQIHMPPKTRTLVLKHCLKQLAHFSSQELINFGQQKLEEIDKDDGSNYPLNRRNSI